MAQVGIRIQSKFRILFHDTYTLLYEGRARGCVVGVGYYDYARSATSVEVIKERVCDEVNYNVFYFSKAIFWN